MFKESEFYKNINETAKEAALGGHTDLTLALVNLGADINEAVWAAALGGHTDLTLALVNLEADIINEAALGAAQGTI